MKAGAPPGEHKGKTAVALPGNTTAFQQTQYGDLISDRLDSASTSLLRALSARLTRLGLSHSSTDSNAILIAGQAYDLRSATAMVRQLGRAV